jgi:putative transposase
MAFQPFDPKAETQIHRRRLPHWHQRGVTYFITARLADSIPRAVAEEWRRERDGWLARHGVASVADLDLDRLDEATRRDYHRSFTARFHELVDECRGECLLARPECAARLIERLAAGHGGDYALDAWCIMPNHLHALVEPEETAALSRIVASWKGGSSREINRMLGRSGSLWQREAFDHIVRSEEQLALLRRYIRENPSKAGLRSGFVVGDGAEVLAWPSKDDEGGGT